MIRPNYIIIGLWSSKKNISIFELFIMDLHGHRKKENCVNIYEIALNLRWCGN